MAALAEWLPEEEAYLANIHRSCVDLGHLYDAYYEQFKVRTAQFRLPAILIGALTSAVSFSAESFPVPFRGYVNVVVGGTSLVIAILNTLESYFEYGKIMAGARSASAALKKIADDITVELALPVVDRETAGVFFLRSIYTRYQQVLNTAPYLEMSPAARIAVKNSAAAPLMLVVATAPPEGGGPAGDPPGT